MSRSKRARRFQMDDEALRPDPTTIDPFSPTLLIGRLRAACDGATEDVGFIETLVEGAHATTDDQTTLCQNLKTIYEPLWSGLAPIYTTFPVLYGLLGRPPTPASIVQAIWTWAPNLLTETLYDPLAGVWRMAAEADARRWAGVASEEWRSRVGPGAFEGAHEARVAMAPHETRRPTMADLLRAARPDESRSVIQRYHLAATRDAQGPHPVVALLLADGRPVASLDCLYPPGVRGAIECAVDVTRLEDLPADTTPYMRDLIADDRALGALLHQIAMPAAFGGLYGPVGAVRRDLWDVSPAARPALLAASRPGARWLVADLDEHQLAAALESERNVEDVARRLTPLASETLTLAARSARALSRGLLSAVPLAAMQAPDEVKALIAAQRINNLCGRDLTPRGVAHVVDAADALGIPAQMTLERLGPYALCREATDAAIRVLERHRSMSLAD